MMKFYIYSFISLQASAIFMLSVLQCAIDIENVFVSNSQEGMKGTDLPEQ